MTGETNQTLTQRLKEFEKQQSLLREKVEGLTRIYYQARQKQEERTQSSYLVDRDLLPENWEGEVRDITEKTTKLFYELLHTVYSGRIHGDRFRYGQCLLAISLGLNFETLKFYRVRGWGKERNTPNNIKTKRFGL